MKLSDLSIGERAKMLSGPYSGQVGTYKGLNYAGSTLGLMRFDGGASHSLVDVRDEVEKVDAAATTPKKPKGGKNA